ncbi:MAG TPA: glutathione S-transferase N-terminal domain-containing protein [Steroidobacteraceae bacterium]|jgi:glutathione S-transferase
MSTPQITLYGTAYSGHAHRVVLFLLMQEIPYRFVHAPAEVRRSADFLRLNPLGQIPVLEDGSTLIADSNAILVYLARRYAPGSSWLPEEPLAAARVQRWFSIAAGELAYGPALARRITQWGESGDRQRALAIGAQLFTFMDAHLRDTAYLAAAHPTLADLACYSYTAHAPEGGLSLQPYQHIREWLSRIEALPRFQPMLASKLPPEIPQHELPLR